MKHSRYDRIYFEIKEETDAEYLSFIKQFLDKVEKHYINKAWESIISKPVKKTIFGDPNESKFSNQTYKISGINSKGKKSKVYNVTFYNYDSNQYKAVLDIGYIEFKVDPKNLGKLDSLFSDWVQKFHTNLPS